MKLKKKKRIICLLETTLWLFFMAYQAIEGTEITCGFGPLDNYAAWIADEKGGLKFPDYKADAYPMKRGNKNCDPSGFEQKDIKNSSEAIELCKYSVEENLVTCKEGIDLVYLSSILNETLDTLIVSNYNGKVIKVPQNIAASGVRGSFADVTEDLWRGTGSATATDIGLGIRITTDFSPNKNYNGYNIAGEAFSNDFLKLGWKFQGDVTIKLNSKITTVTATIENLEQMGWWKIEMEFVNQIGNSDFWTFTGTVIMDKLSSKKIGFTGEVQAKSSNDSWLFTGELKLQQVNLVAALSGTVMLSKNEEITIRKEFFSGMKIRNIIFQNSNFVKDFDKDAFQGLENLETISFQNCKMEEIPRLDYLFKNLTQLKAIYIEDSIVPDLDLGKEPTLNSLEYFSLKGSGPLELSDSLYYWMKLPNLKYLNLRNSNIKLSFSAGSFLSPHKSSVQYLDVSYTPLTSDTQLWAILRCSKLTHLGAAGLQLKKIPIKSLSAINDTIEYLSLRGNIFEKIPEENMFDIILDFPMMRNLKELDLTQCRINYIEKGIFDNMPNLQTLFISYNSIENLQDGWTTVTPQIKVLDLSYNSAGAISSMITTFDIKTENNFGIFEGLEILDLSNGVYPNLENLVAGLGNNLKLLSLCNTGLKNITSSMFYNLSQLLVLDMSVNENIELNERMSFKLFKSLKSLKYLYLKKCRMTNAVYCQIEDVFDNNTNLNDYLLKEVELIDLSRNNIKAVDVKAFKLFPNLKTLDLSGNSITSWSENLKTFNNKLETVYLDDNKIDKLEKNMLSDIYSLKEVTLGKNPFVCGCYVNEIMEKIRENEISFEICHPKRIKPFVRNVNKSRGYYVDVVKPKKRRNVKENNILNFIQRAHKPVKCNLDNIASRSEKLKKNCVQILDWSDENYTCSDSEMRVLPFGQTNFTANCNDDRNDDEISFLWLFIAAGVMVSSFIILGLIYWKRWEIKLFTKAVKNAAVLSIMGHKDYEPIPFQYHVFVSYSDHDRQWILESLLPHIESWTDLKVCLHERDFQVGLSIVENIMASIDKSRCIMLVLSKSFIKSQWCQYEMHLAQHRLLESRRELILILLENIPKSKRPKALQYLMMTNTYIQWPRNPENKGEIDIFWKRVYKALKASAAENHI